MRRQSRLAVATCLLAVAARVLALSWGNSKVTQLSSEVTSFLVVGDWGGQAAAPYTTPGQLAAAAGMSKIAASEAAAFIVSAGGNFYGGLPGATALGGPSPVRRSARRPSADCGRRAALRAATALDLLEVTIWAAPRAQRSSRCRVAPAVRPLEKKANMPAVGRLPAGGGCPAASQPPLFWRRNNLPLIPEPAPRRGV